MPTTKYEMRVRIKNQAELAILVDCLEAARVLAMDQAPEHEVEVARCRVLHHTKNVGWLKQLITVE